MTLGGQRTGAGSERATTLAERFRAHAGDEQHLYGHAMRAMADDWESGGVARRICAGWETAPAGAMVSLRLLAGVARIVLRGDAPALAAFYPCLDGAGDPALAWPVMRDVMLAHEAELSAALAVPPQTNEVGRSSALLVGLSEAVRAGGLSQVRLLEPGASAGLNLLVDRFRFESEGWVWGPPDSPLVLRDGIKGYAGPLAFQIVSRRGCDLSPLDASDPQDRLRLRSFVWPFHVERHERLDAALAVASDEPPQVDHAPAGVWLEEQLAAPVDDGVLTVVWQSATRLYWPEQETRRVERAIAAGRARTPLAHVAMEDPLTGAGDHAELSLDGQVLATVGHHGTPVRLLADRSR